MRGIRPIQWLWEWLGYLGQGEEYELLPSVQPVAMLTGMDMPLQLGRYATPAPVNLIAGTVSQNLPSAPDGKSRLWLALSYQRSAVAAGDYTALARSLTGNGVIDVWAAQAGTVPAGVWIPMIGGRQLLLSGTVITQHAGLSPVLVNPRTEILIASFTAAAAAGNFSLNGIYVDVPVSAAMPPDFLHC